MGSARLLPSDPVLQVTLPAVALRSSNTGLLARLFV